MESIRQFSIGGKTVGQGCPCFLIAEIGLSHEGSLGIARAGIDAAADAGVDAVKFQTHIAEAESTRDEAFRVRVFPQDATRQDYWRRTQFTEDEWLDLRRHAQDRDLVFLSSPFSLEAVHLLQRVGVQGWKIASGETNNLEMLKGMIDSDLPFLVSTGMSYLNEIDETVRLLQDRRVPFILYQCTNRYPCPPEHLGLNLLQEFQARYGCLVGLSDHSGKIGAGLAASTLGACSLEVHVTFHRKFFGPDVSSSLPFEELALLADNLRYLEAARAHPVDKDEESRSLESVRSLFTKSVVAAIDLPAGVVLAPVHLAIKKPGTGIPAKELPSLFGKKTVRALKADEILTWNDIGDE